MKISSKEGKSRIYFLAFLLVLAVGGVWGVKRFLKRPDQQVSIRLGLVEKQDLIQRITVAGGVYPNKTSSITAPYAAYIKKLYVTLGEHVEAGDPIVALSPSLQVTNDENYPLRSPFTGTVVQILKSEGEFVDTTIANAMARIDDLTKLYIWANVSEADIDKIHKGLDAEVKASGILNRSYHASIEQISISARERRDWNDTSIAEFPVKMFVTDKDRQLKPGMSVLADIVVGRKNNVVAIRQEFVERDGNTRYVTLESGERRKVSTGLENEDIIEITSGLKEGERVRQIDFLALSRMMAR